MSLYVIKNDISLTTFTSNRAFGSTQGLGYSLVGWMESPVRRISFHTGKTFGRIVVEKHDGSCVNFGGAPVEETSKYRPTVWTFEKDDRLDKIELFSNGQVLAAVRLTVKGRSESLKIAIDGFDIDSSKPEQRMEVPQGTGKWVGVYGNHDMHVLSLGFAMLRS